MSCGLIILEIFSMFFKIRQTIEDLEMKAKKNLNQNQNENLAEISELKKENSKQIRTINDLK